MTIGAKTRHAVAVPALNPAANLLGVANHSQAASQAMTPSQLSKVVGIQPMTALPCKRQSLRRVNPKGHQLIYLRVLYQITNAITAARHRLNLLENLAADLKVGVENPVDVRASPKVSLM
jgi:hypothetical protein